MTTSNLTITGTAALPSATNTVLGGVQIPTVSGLSVDGSGNVSVNAGTALAINPTTGQLHVTTSSFLSSTGGEVATKVGVYDSGLSGYEIEMTADGSGAYLIFEIPDGGSTIASGITFADGTFQGTAFTTDALLNLTLWTSNDNHLVWTGDTDNTISLGQYVNLQVIQLSSYPESLSIVFPTPLNDGQFFELVIIGGSGGYTVSGVGIDGSTAATIFFEFGSTSYEKGGFRYSASANTWYQVS